MSRVDVAGTRRALRRYAGALGWLAATLWQAFRWRVVGAVAAAQAGVVVVGAGLGLSLRYFRTLEDGGTLRLGDVALAAREDTTLGLAVVVVLVVLLAGAGILYAAQRSIIAMAAELNHHVRMRVALAYGGDLPNADDWRSERAMWRALWLLQTRDARRTAIVARSLLRNSVHVGITVVGLAALFYLQATMTVLLLGVVAVALVSHYRANAASAGATHRYEAVAPGTRKRLHKVLPSLQTLGQPAPPRDELEAAFDQDAVAEETTAFRDRFGAHIHAEFLGFAIMGVALAVLIAYLGRQALVGAMPWTAVLAYLVVLRFTVNGLRQLLATVAFFSRFYPSIDRLNRFFAATTAAASAAPLPALALHGRDGAAPRTDHDGATAPIRPGEVVEVVLPVGLSRYSLGLLAAVFAGDQAPARQQFLGHTAMAAPLSTPPAPASMHSLLALDGGWDAATLRARLGDHADGVERTVGLDPHARVAAEAWADLPAAAAASLVLTAAEASPRPVLAVDRRLIGDADLAALAARAGDRFLVVCSTGRPAGDDAAGISRTVVVSTGGAILAVGAPAWVARHWDELREDAPAPAAVADGEADFDDAEE